MEIKTFMQDEVIVALQKYSEFIAAQQQTTQLVIIIVLLIIAFGIAAVIVFRGGLQTFKQLSRSIDKLASVESERFEGQKQLVKSNEKIVEKIHALTQQQIEQSEIINREWVNVTTGLTNVQDSVNNLYELLKDNPEQHRQLYTLMVDLRETMQETKHKTDELRPIND